MRGIVSAIVEFVKTSVRVIREAIPALKPTRESMAVSTPTASTPAASTPAAVNPRSIAAWHLRGPWPLSAPGPVQIQVSGKFPHAVKSIECVWELTGGLTFASPSLTMGDHLLRFTTAGGTSTLPTRMAVLVSYDMTQVGTQYTTLASRTQNLYTLNLNAASSGTATLTTVHATLRGQRSITFAPVVIFDHNGARIVRIVTDDVRRPYGRPVVEVTVG